MGRLSGAKSRLVSLPTRLGGAGKSEVERNRQRDQTQHWRAWYKTARWQQLRLKVLKRDGLICQVTQVLLIGKYPAPNSPVVDHRIPHRGNPVLFWDLDNLQAVSKKYHDGAKQSIEKSGRY